MEYNKFTQSYQANSNGEIDQFCLRLNCYEQPSYFELRKVSNINPWIFFCDDINMRISKNTTGYDIFAYTTGIKDKYQRAVSCKIEKRYFEKITEILHENEAILLKTAFNYIVDYAWWKEGIGDPYYYHTNHYSYVIGENKYSYFIVDSPFVFRNVDSIRTLDNKAIVEIPKQHFINAFEKYCEITSLHFSNLPSDRMEERIYFLDNIKEICINFYKPCVGKNALELFINATKNQDESIFDDSFAFHMLLSRRIILNECVNIFKDDINNFNCIIKLLDHTIEHWRQMKILANNSQISVEAKFKEAEYLTNEIMEVEMKIIDNLLKFVENK